MIVTDSQKIKWIETCLGPSKASNSGKNISVKCLSCVKKGKVTEKKKLSIDLSSGIYHCWVCEAKGRNIGRFCLKFSSNRSIAEKLNDVFGAKNQDRVDSEDQSEIVPLPTLPNDFQLVYKLKKSKMFRKHFEYLVSRNINLEKMKSMRIGVSNEYGFKDRVIFPSFDENLNLNYYVSRSIDPSCKMRYKNYKGKRKELIFRECDIDFSKQLVLVEGVFDLTSCPENSTCILGSNLNEEYLLFQKIVKNNTPVVLCLDPDAIDKTYKIAKLLSEYCIEVKISQNQNRDFGDMSSAEAENYILNAKLYDNVSRVAYLINDIRSGSLF